MEKGQGEERKAGILKRINQYRETGSREAGGQRGKGNCGSQEPGRWGGGGVAGVAGRGVGPGAAGDRWVDTKSRAAGKTDGWGREGEGWRGSGWRP